MLCTLLSLKTEKRGHKPRNVVHLQKLEKAGKIATSIPVLESLSPNIIQNFRLKGQEQCHM